VNNYPDNIIYCTIITNIQNIEGLTENKIMKVTVEIKDKRKESKEINKTV